MAESNKLEIPQQLLDIANNQEPLLPELKRYLRKGDGIIGWMMLQHPLVYSIPYLDIMNADLNAQFRHKSEYAEKARKDKDWGRYIWIHERPYRWEKLSEVASEMTDEEFWQTFGSIWTDSENIWQYIPLILELLESAAPEKRHLMMSEDERKALALLPEELLVYRGCNSKNRIGMSWTIDPERAEWFALRFANKDAMVISGKVLKKDVIAYFTGRNESEIVVLPHLVKFKKIKKVKKTKKNQE